MMVHTRRDLLCYLCTALHWLDAELLLHIGGGARLAEGRGTGILRYYGWLRSDGHDGTKSKRRPEWCGVSLDNAVGTCDGSHGKSSGNQDEIRTQRGHW